MSEPRKSIELTMNVASTHGSRLESSGADDILSADTQVLVTALRQADNESHRSSSARSDMIEDASTISEELSASHRAAGMAMSCRPGWNESAHAMEKSVRSTRKSFRSCDAAKTGTRLLSVCAAQSIAVSAVRRSFVCFASNLAAEINCANICLRFAHVEPRMPKTVEVGPIYHNGEAQKKVEAWLQAHGEYAGWRWEGEW